MVLPGKKFKGNVFGANIIVLHPGSQKKSRSMYEMMVYFGDALYWYFARKWMQFQSGKETYTGHQRGSATKIGKKTRRVKFRL